MFFFLLTLSFLSSFCVFESFLFSWPLKLSGARAPMTGGGHLACALLALLSVVRERKVSHSLALTHTHTHTRINNIRRVDRRVPRCARDGAWTLVLIGAIINTKCTMLHGVYLTLSERTQTWMYCNTRFHVLNLVSEVFENISFHCSCFLIVQPQRHRCFHYNENITCACASCVNLQNGSFTPI